MAPGVVAEALNVPCEIGQRAIERLHADGVDLPAIEIPGPPPRYALLAQPHTGPPHGVLDRFVGHDVGYAHGGPAAQWGIDLPPTQHAGCTALRWVRPPDVPLPALRVIAKVVLAVLTPDSASPGVPAEDA